MGLVDLTTDLKSLRYGMDRLGGGSSNQPYIKSPIPKGDNIGRDGGIAFMLRGGYLTPGIVAEDVSRLTQMFFDLKSPNGLLFTAKQNVLSRSGVATQASGGILNEGAYLPTSTILQAAANPFGGHLNKQGIDPTRRTGPDSGQNGLFDLLNIKDPLGLPVYRDVVAKDQPALSNRLVQFNNSKIQVVPTQGDTLYSYNGGPGSDIGIGKTIIKLSSERTGRNNPELISVGFFNDITNGFTNYNSAFLGGNRSTPLQYQGERYFNNPNNVTNTYQSLTGTSFPENFTEFFDNTSNSLSGLRRFNLSVYNPGTLTTPPANYKAQGINAFTQQQIIDAQVNGGSDVNGITASTPVKDFRQTIAPGGNASMPNSLSYTEFNIEQRVNLGTPGRTKGINKSSYVKGTQIAGKSLGPLDKITAFPLYKSTSVTNNKVKNDLCKFRIGVIDNDNPKKKTYIHFRAFLNDFKDDYKASWNGENFMGRGEKLYRYSGFDRNVSLSWTVAAQSKQELIPMYQKLNYLASVCAPDYSKTGYMRGNLITLTVGGYLYEQTGIMTGISFNVPTESPWEIAIPDRGDVTTVGSGNNTIASDPTVKELPHIIEVSGFNLIPIHNFVPEVQNNTFNNKFTGGPEGEGSGDVLSTFGKQRYISLKNKFNNNYDS